MPVEHNELDDRIQEKDINGVKAISVRNYGLPMIFWGYLMAIFAVIFFMILAINEPLMRAFNGEDQINQVIALVVMITLGLAPITLLAVYFYEKEILKHGKELEIIHRVFFIPVRKVRVSLNDEGLVLEHYLDSLNVAAAQKKDGMAGFENRGHYKIMAHGKKGDVVLVDRNSRRGEMRKLKELLDSY